MSYEVTITLNDNYLHVIAEGRSSLENATELWQNIAAACRSHNCFNVLGEQRLQNPTTTMDAWNHQSIFINAGITSKYLIAWVDHNPKTFKQTEFVRTVLANRDIGYGKLFSDTEEAKSWLLKKIEAKAKRKSSPT
ncbi:MAG: hypothetical protein ABW044_10495 [Cellvibrio sp.]